MADCLISTEDYRRVVEACTGGGSRGRRRGLPGALAAVAILCQTSKRPPSNVAKPLGQRRGLGTFERVMGRGCIPRHVQEDRQRRTTAGTYIYEHIRFPLQRPRL